jgi:hypothetical protein
MLNRNAVDKALKDTQRENLEKTKKISKDRLTAVAEKKVKTVFIGAIDSIENRLGKFLWGHDKDPRDRTEKELQWLEIWKELREEILNKGNNQLRGLLLEISEYDVVWNKKQLYFDLTGEKNAK